MTTYTITPGQSLSSAIFNVVDTALDAVRDTGVPFRATINLNSRNNTEHASFTVKFNAHQVHDEHARERAFTELEKAARIMARLNTREGDHQ